MYVMNNCIEIYLILYNAWFHKMMIILVLLIKIKNLGTNMMSRRKVNISTKNIQHYYF